MKKLLFAVTALAALSLLAPSTGFAAYNQLGCYTDDDMAAASVTAAANSQNDVYVVLSNPYNHDTDTDILAIGGIEFKFVLGGASAMLLGNPAWTHDSVIDIGTDDSHIAGFGTPLLVGDGGFVTVCVQNVMVFDASSAAYLYLAPALPASIPGVMVLLDSDEGLHSIYPSSGDFANPVFALNGTVTATDHVRMDQIKAMYR